MSNRYLVSKHKRGDTLDLSGVLQMDKLGTDDFTGWSADAQVRAEDGSIIETLSFTWLDATVGACRIVSANDTSGWPLGRAFFDVQFTTDTGAILSSPTVTLLISEDVTQ